jgi:hypothetical protein
MFGQLNVWVLALAATAMLAGTAEASYRRSNSLSHVSTHIIPNWNNTGSDVCFVHNSNNVPVSVLVSVFPTGTIILGFDNWTIPVGLGPFAATSVYSWTALRPGSEYCKVVSVR